MTRKKKPINQLTMLGQQYKTDKVRWGYTNLYYEYFHDYQLTFKGVLEVGIKHGASLRMWRDFFERAKIFGIDIKKDRCFQEDRIVTFQSDQSDKKKMKSDLKQKLGREKKFDLIIDDGNHKWYDQQITFALLFRYLKYEGWYVIEDVNTSLLSKFGDIESESSTLNVFWRFQETAEMLSDFLTESECINFERKVSYCKVHRLNDDKNIIVFLRKRKALSEKDIIAYRGQ